MRNFDREWPGLQHCPSRIRDRRRIADRAAGVARGDVGVPCCLGGDAVDAGLVWGGFSPAAVV